jgi:hypothetical protein
MTTTLATPVGRPTEDLDWGPGIIDWDPAKHPRDRRGRFTRSRTVDLTDDERDTARAVIAGFTPERFATGTAAGQYLADNAPTLTAEQDAALNYYTGDGFREINNSLRAGNTEGVKTTVADLRAAMQPLPDDLILTRTVSMDAFGSVPIEELAGKKVTDAGFSSTALGVAYGGTYGRVRISIAAPAGTPAIFVGPLSNNPAEREVLLGDGLSYAVASVTKNDAYGYDMSIIVLPKDTPSNLARALRRLRDAVEELPPDPEVVDDIDLGPVQATFEAALAALLATWAGRILVDWIDDLTDQVRRILRGDGGRLTDLTITTRDAITTVTDALADLAGEAAGHVVDEADAQDVTLQPAVPPRSQLEDTATVTVELLADVYELSAAREAQRLAGPDADPAEVAERVAEHLGELTDAQPAQQLGAALQTTQNAARAATLAAGPTGAVYASEQLDRNTCAPCRAVHGRWICNTDDLGPLHKLYPTAGYVDCRGGVRCRGTFVGVWRQQGKDAA